jgi:hypothetical protein
MTLHEFAIGDHDPGRILAGDALLYVDWLQPAGEPEDVLSFGMRLRPHFKAHRLRAHNVDPNTPDLQDFEVEDWPLVIIKELFDNALDGCEEAGIAPCTVRQEIRVF